MFFSRGSQELRDDLTIPGTTVLVGEGKEITGLGLANTKENSDIILFPQPSSDPNDPLNWAQWRKVLHFIVLFFFSTIVAAAVNFDGPIYDVMAETYNCSYNELNTGGGIAWLFIAISCLLCQEVAAKIGRRPIYLFSTILAIISGIIFVTRRTFAGYIGFSIVNGFSAGPVDSLVEVSIADVFFLHEHGKFIGVYLISNGIGSSFGPFLAGYIYEYLGWLWCGYMVIIICGGLFVAEFFLLEESFYVRHYETDEIVEEKLLKVVLSNKSHDHEGELYSDKAESNEKLNFNVDEIACSDVDNNQRVKISKDIKPKTYMELLKPFIITENRISILSILKNLIVLRYPAVTWAAIVYGLQMCWLSLITVSQSEFFQAPPYNFSADALGLLNLSITVGNTIGGIYAAFSDKFVIYMSQKNGGVFEPEFRLLMNIVPLVLNIGGLFMYGLGPLYGAPWIVAAIGIALISFGICTTTSLAVTYVLECYPGETVQTMTSVLVVRNLLATVFTFVFQYWLDGVGVLGTTIMLACFCLVSSGSYIIMYWNGKAARKYTMKWYSPS